MQVLAFSLWDSKAQYFSTPVFFAHRGQAIRAAIETGSDLNTQVGRHPSDFHLMEIGSFDDQTGQFTAIVPVNLGLVQALLPRPATPLPAMLEERLQPRPNGKDDDIRVGGAD